MRQEFRVQGTCVVMIKNIKMGKKQKNQKEVGFFLHIDS